MRLLLLLILFAAMRGVAPASAAEPSIPDPALLTAGFLAAHPDIQHRTRALKAYEEGDHALAFKEFKRAACFSDKPSQAMVAEMLWTGEGVERDPVAAYAWMDLAAERHYRGFLLRRETYWAALDEAQREQAIKVGEKIYAEYGDVVAKPRLVTRLKRGSRKVAGSRTGFIGAVQIDVQMPNGDWHSVDATSYFHERYWDPQKYFEWQDGIWNAPRGRVDIGPLQSDAPNGD